MKKLFTILVSLFVLTSLNAQLLTENFNYSGALTSNGWAAHSAGGTNVISTGTGLIFANYSGSGVGNAAIVKGSGEDINKTFSSSPNSGTVYVSFLVAVNDTLTTTGDYFTGIYATATTFFARTFVKKNADNTFEFGIGKASASATAPVSPVYTSGSYSFGTTYLVAIKYEYLSGSSSDDIASIFVFSAAPPTTEPVATLTNNVGSDAATLTGVILRQGTAANKVGVTVDAIHAGTTWSTIIPVELVDFQAHKENKSTKLVWQTATELNNSHYDIERSSEGKTFEKIGKTMGLGNSQQSRSYTFMDEKPNNGINYYRLRQVDLDGKATISKTVTVNFDHKTALKIYPSLANDKINIDIHAIEGVSNLSVINASGQVVKSEKVQITEGSLSLNINDLPNGIYFIELSSKIGKWMERFEKQ